MRNSGNGNVAKFASNMIIACNLAALGSLFFYRLYISALR